jgi:hypothetical protein
MSKAPLIPLTNSPEEQQDLDLVNAQPTEHGKSIIAGWITYLRQNLIEGENETAQFNDVMTNLQTFITSTATYPPMPTKPKDLNKFLSRDTYPTGSFPPSNLPSAPEEVKSPEAPPTVPAPTPVPTGTVIPIPSAPSAPSSVIATPIPPIAAPPVQTPAANQATPEVETASMLAPELETFDISIIPEPNIIDFIRFGTEIPNLTTLNEEDNALLHANEIQHNERFRNNFYRHSDNFNQFNSEQHNIRHTKIQPRRELPVVQTEMTEYFTAEPMMDTTYGINSGQSLFAQV